MEVNTHIEALPDLLPGGTLLPTEYEVWWFSETLYTILKIEKSLILPGLEARTV
jgi:hypothetical protein